MFNHTGRTLAILLALPLFFAACRADAQTYPCAGPGPGEIMVGMAPGGPGVAPQPMCQQVSQGSGGQQAAARLPDVYMSVIWHPDTPEVWVAKGFLSGDESEKRALDACADAMGEGCKVGTTWYNDATIVVVNDLVGNVFIYGAATSREAKNGADADCEKFSTECRRAKTIKNSFSREELDFPSGPIARRTFGAVARPKGKIEGKWDDSAWIATGAPGYRVAEETALSQCHKDSGFECDVRVSAGNGLIARVVDDKGHVYWWDVPSDRALDKAIKASCDKQRTCRVVDTFDVRKPGVEIIEVSKSSHPLRGFFALARPSDPEAAKKWRKRALVSGMPSVDAAADAAIAMCEKDSGSKCEAPYKDDDRGTDQFMELTRMGDDSFRSFMGMSQESAETSRYQYCVKHTDESCAAGVTVDLATKASTLLSP